MSVVSAGNQVIESPCLFFCSAPWLYTGLLFTPFKPTALNLPLCANKTFYLQEKGALLLIGRLYYRLLIARPK